MFPYICSLTVNTYMTDLLDIPILGGLTVGVVLFINILVARYILQYQRETREEYSRRLTRAVIELEAQRTANLRLEFDNERLKNLLKSD
jgi:uncharacterized membrane protein (DUF485 family)